MNTQSVSLDISKRPNIAQTLYLGQGDKSGTVLQASLYDNGSPLSLTNYTVRFSMRLPNGSDFYRVVGTKSGNTATFQIDETYAAAFAGETDIAYVEVLSGSTIIASTGRIHVVVLESATSGASQGEAYVSQIDQLMSQLESGISSASDATTAANTAASAANTAAGNADSKATAANTAAGSANSAASAANSAASAANNAKTAADNAASAANSAASAANTAASNANTKAGLADTAASGANTAAGRANSAADAAEAFLDGFTVEYSNLSQECKDAIAQAASTGASFISDEQGIAIVDDMAALIMTGREAGTLTDEQGLAIVDDIFS